VVFSRVLFRSRVFFFFFLHTILSVKCAAANFAMNNPTSHRSATMPTFKESHK